MAPWRSRLALLGNGRWLVALPWRAIPVDARHCAGCGWRLAAGGRGRDYFQQEDGENCESEFMWAPSAGITDTENIEEGLEG